MVSDHANPGQSGATPSPGTAAVEWQRHRDKLRRSLLRASTAVAIILIAVLGLALAAVLASLRATRHQQAAEEAQRIGRAELWRAYVSEARAARQGSALDRRQAGWRALTNAALIEATAELRDEAIATLALPEYSLDHSWPLSTDVTAQGFDRKLRHYALGLAQGDIVVRRVSDNGEFLRLRSADGDIPSRQGAATGLEFSPEGDRLAVRYEKGGIAVWNLASGKTILRHALEQVRSTLSRPRFTADGRFLLSVTTVPRQGVAIFNLSNAEPVAFFPQFPSWSHIAPRPGTNMFAVNTETNAVLIIEWPSGELVKSLPFPGAIERMAWSPDGNNLALGGSTVDIHLWNLVTEQRRILTGHTADVRHLAFDSEGQLLASASGDATSRLWEVASGRLLGTTDRGFFEQFGENGQMAVRRVKETVEFWSFRPSSVYRALTAASPVEGATWPMDLSPDGRWLTSLVFEKGLLLWDLAGGAKPTWFEMRGAHLISYHPKPDRMEILVTDRRETKIRQIVLDPPTPSSPGTLTTLPSLPLPTNFSPHWISISGNAHTMALGDAINGQTFVIDRDQPESRIWLKGLRHLTWGEAESPGASVTGGGTLALSGDGRWAACGYVYPRGAKVWDARSGDIVTTLASVNAIVQFSPDDQRLVAGTPARYQMFRTDDWRELWRVPRVGAISSPGPCAFSPDGRQLAVAISRQTAALLDAATGRELTQLTAPRPATIKTIRWSRDGQRLVIGTAENLIQLWDLPTLHSNLLPLHLAWNKREAPRLAEAARNPDDNDNSNVANSERPALASGVPIHPTSRADVTGALVLGLFTAGVVTVVALLALRRHRQLIKEFARTEALAEQRERELRVEREVNRIKSNFVSMVSHEFRTPLGVIRAAGDSLVRYFARLSDNQRSELLGDITDSTRRMSDLIEEVLLLGRVESGRMECQPAPIDVAAVCRGIIAEVQKAAHESHPIEFVGDDLPPTVRVDETLVRIFLINLLSNAVKYSAPGKPVRLSATIESGERGHITFKVSDQGIGIPAADAPELFKSFHRGRNVGAIPGTGLGLTIVRRCVELHGGTVTFESTEGVGTTFRVQLPTRQKTEPS